MNPLLQEKISALNDAQKYECWYLVKHSVAFDNLCYLVSFLKKYQEEIDKGNLETYITNHVQQINEEKGMDISTNYRALRVASFFGLITQKTTGYVDAITTESFYEITALCDGNYENTHIYNHVIQRQIEKMYISSSVDEENNGVRINFRLYPVILLYKILLEIGRASGKFRITTNEYRYLVATTERYENFLDTLLLINLLRRDSETNTQLETFRTKFDNRMIQALKLLDTLDITNTHIQLKDEYIDLVSKKVFEFEKNTQIFNTDDYLEFLGSTKSLFDLTKEDTENNEDIQVDEKDRMKGGTNILLYGVPGSGKSHTIKNEYCNDPSLMERIVFHPDYTYSDFVGQILPQVNQEGESNTIEYKFIPGPFTRILKACYEDSEAGLNHHRYLIIEEINRGNAPAIFGEVFQLLDRCDDPTKGIVGESEYGISNTDIAKEVYGDENIKVRIPSNLTILATMNTADQNVFTLDTAFKRRWKMKAIRNKFVNDLHCNHSLCGTTLKWKDFAIKINEKIIEFGESNLGSEDNRLGVYFLKDNEMDDVSTFSEKILMYLWSDVFKYNREDIFVNSYKTLEDLIDGFAEFKFEVFNEDLGFGNVVNIGITEVEQIVNETIEDEVDGE